MALADVRAMRRVAGLGLPDRSAFPELLRHLRDLVPFDTAAMLWLRPDGAPVEVYRNYDAPEGALARYGERWFNRDEAAFYPTQREMQRNPALEVVRVSDHSGQLRHTEIYDEVFRAQNHHWIVAIALKDGNRPIGNLGIGRPLGAPDFSDDELGLLRQVRPYMVQALARDPKGTEPTADMPEGHGFFVVDGDGRIKHASAGAWRLLQGVCGAPEEGRLFDRRAENTARPRLAALAHSVTETITGAGLAPARTIITNAYGRFVVHAYGLEPVGGAEGPEFLIQIERRLPLAALMLRSPDYRRLSDGEQQIAEMLGLGLSYNEIARCRNTAYSTIVTQVRTIGDKLHVSGRDAIVRALLPPT